MSLRHGRLEYDTNRRVGRLGCLPVPRRGVMNVYPPHATDFRLPELRLAQDHRTRRQRDLGGGLLHLLLRLRQSRPGRAPGLALGGLAGAVAQAADAETPAADHNPVQEVIRRSGTSLPSVAHHPLFAGRLSHLDQRTWLTAITCANLRASGWIAGLSQPHLRERRCWQPSLDCFASVSRRCCSPCSLPCPPPRHRQWWWPTGTTTSTRICLPASLRKPESRSTTAPTKPTPMSMHCCARTFRRMCWCRTSTICPPLSARVCCSPWTCVHCPPMRISTR